MSRRFYRSKRKSDSNEAVAYPEIDESLPARQKQRAHNSMSRLSCKG